jgi:hypothetical protein
VSERLRVSDRAAGALIRRTSLAEALFAPRFRYQVVCRDRAGRVRWLEGVANLVTIQGKDDLLAKYFKGAAYTAAWFVGLIDSTGFSAVDDNDTMSSHSGWTENTAAYATTRQALTLGTPAAASVDNADNLATFSMTGNATIQGSFVASQSARGGSGGILYSASAWQIPRAVLIGDVLTVKTTLTV